LPRAKEERVVCCSTECELTAVRVTRVSIHHPWSGTVTRIAQVKSTKTAESLSCVSRPTKYRLLTNFDPVTMWPC
jgi:hypothetical protein